MSVNPSSCPHTPLQFACLSQSRLFCISCYSAHSNKCLSSRCGNLKRLTITLSKNLQFLKLKDRLRSLSYQPQKANKLLNSVQQATFQITNHMIKCMHVEIPMIIYSKLNELFIQMFGGVELSEKIERMENQVKYVIDTNPVHEQGDYKKFLEKVMAEIQETEKQKKEKAERGKGQMTKELQIKIRKIEQAFTKGISELSSTRRYFFEQLKNSFSDLSSQASASEKSLKHISYQQLEQFNIQDFDIQKSRRYGIDFDMNSLEKQPQSLITYCKNLLRQQQYNTFIKEKYQGFPYSDCYIISTTTTPSPSLQNLILKLEVQLIDSIVKRVTPSLSSQRLCSLSKRILILGPQLIDIAINPLKDMNNLKISIKTYCDQTIYKEEREVFLKDLLSILGIQLNESSKTPFKDNVMMLKFKSELSRAYCYFQLAREILEGRGRYGEGEGGLKKGKEEDWVVKGRDGVKEMTEKIKKFKNIGGNK